MDQNYYRVEAKKGKRGIFWVSESSAILANQTLMSKQIDGSPNQTS
jgi:hypothetical protein